MRCPTCHADNPTGSFVCHACLRPLPLTEGGEVPMTVETGAPPSTRFVRQPSEWTTPIQVTAAIYLLLSAVVSVLALALGQEGFTRAFVLSATARGTNLTIDQLTSTAHVSYEGVLVLTAFVAALKALLAAGGFMRWSWVYILDMVLLALSALSTLGTLLLVPSIATSGTILGQALIPVVLDLAGICLFAWMAVAVSRYGIWACRKIPIAG
jgi:hypothetical protein